MISYALIMTAPAKEHLAHKGLKEVPEILEIHPLFGEYNLIVKIESEGLEDFKEYSKKLKEITGVIGTRELVGNPHF